MGRKLSSTVQIFFIRELEQFHSTAPLFIAYANTRTTFNLRTFQEQDLKSCSVILDGN